MPSMNVEVPNPLGREQGTLRLKDFLERVKTRYQGQVSNFSESWSDNVLTFAFTTYGFTINGKLTVDESVARVEGELPFAAMFFQGRIESSIKEELAKALNEKPAA